MHFKNRMMEEVVGIWMKKLIVCGTMSSCIKKVARESFGESKAMDCLIKRLGGRMKKFKR